MMQLLRAAVCFLFLWTVFRISTQPPQKDSKYCVSKFLTIHFLLKKIIINRSFKIGMKTAAKAKKAAQQEEESLL